MKSKKKEFPQDKKSEKILLQDEKQKKELPQDKKSEKIFLQDEKICFEKGFFEKQNNPFSKKNVTKNKGKN